MPPKKDAPSKKTVDKQKAKIVEDKTFGLKNKKGNKQQKYIEQVQKQVTTKPVRRVDPLDATKDKKEKEKEKAEELKTLFKPVIAQQKVAKDVDPKSVLCAFFKVGQCGKGDKCKFSHNLEVERKTEKRNIYSDSRDNEKDEGMENWDDEKLQDVVNKKHGEEEALKPKTDIVCKFFLQAIEESKYGWFWECPNGGDKCIYKHALPPGFVLKKDKKKMDEQLETISLEDLIEKERAALGGNLTKVTLESFKAWKTKKRKERIEKMEADKKRKENEFQAGRLNGLSGRDMFTFRPELAGEDDDEADDTVYKHEDDEDEENYMAKDIDESLFVEEEVDGTGTISATTIRSGVTSHLPDLEAASTPSTSKDTIGTDVVIVDDVPVDTELFDEEDDEVSDEEVSDDGEDEEGSETQENNEKENSR
ncbi:zinc finger CCCH domain-containing protein 15-like [Paramacrobiotus metropolitanus]|uniref:zinc finger CCCH domain-containing protein 15-like n=1 Tax=Paramacrobiotus metropolitanus TaxID=2943436 RepID=UPI0024457CA0|nr:zinc finger CCCH domain-containing protein 15-like [Paramacrobiotus metropolitanus]